MQSLLAARSEVWCGEHSAAWAESGTAGTREAGAAERAGFPESMERLFRRAGAAADSGPDAT